MKFINKIIDYFRNLKKDSLKKDLWKYKYAYWKLNENEFLINFINKTAYDLAKSENLNIYVLPSDEMDGCTGCFRYFKDKDYTLYEKYRKCLNDLNINYETYKPYPRIELSENADMFTLLHELGHYFIYKNNGVQSEEAADKYIYEFINEHLPPFFKWVFQIEIKCYAGVDINFTDDESFEHYNECMNFIK